MKARKIALVFAIAAVAFLVFALVYPDDKDTPEGRMAAAKAEISMLYTELEGYIKAGKFEQPGWIGGKEERAWETRLTDLIKRLRADKAFGPDLSDEILAGGLGTLKLSYTLTGVEASEEKKERREELRKQIQDFLKK